jgi:hypothetical protein
LSFFLTKTELISLMHVPDQRQNLCHLSSAALTRLGCDFLARALTATEGVTLSTHEKQTRYWNLWLQYLEKIELGDDKYRKRLDEWDRPRICCAFAHAYRSGYFEKEGRNANGHQVVADTVDTALFYEANTFRDNDHEVPVMMITSANAHFYCNTSKAAETPVAPNSGNTSIDSKYLPHVQDRRLATY